MIDPAPWPALGQYRWRWQAQLACLQWRGAKIVHVNRAFHLLDQECRRFAVAVDIVDDGGCAGRFVAVVEASVERPAFLSMSGVVASSVSLNEYVARVIHHHAAGHKGDLLSLRRHLDRTLRHRDLLDPAGLHCRLKHLRVTVLPTEPPDLRTEITTWLQHELQIENSLQEPKAWIPLVAQVPVPWPLPETRSPRRSHS